MNPYPQLPECSCEMHPLDGEESKAPRDAIRDPFLYLPPPVEFTPEMAVVADRYLSQNWDWNYYPAFQAAAFLKPKTVEQHTDRKRKFDALNHTAESMGFSVPESLKRLFTTDAHVDRVHHNCVWPRLPDQLVRLPSNPDFAIFLFLAEGQGCGFWHVLLAPDGTHTVINADAGFGCVGGYPSGREPDPATFRVFQCMDSINLLLYHYFIESAKHDIDYVNRLNQYFLDVA